MSEPTMKEQFEEFARAARLAAHALTAVLVPALARFGLTTHRAYAWYVAGGLTRCYL